MNIYIVKAGSQIAIFSRPSKSPLGQSHAQLFCATGPIFSCNLVRTYGIYISVDCRINEHEPLVVAAALAEIPAEAWLLIREDVSPAERVDTLILMGLGALPPLMIRIDETRLV